MNKQAFLSSGGKWLGAVRSWIQWHCINGSSVIWGSNEVLNPPLTVANLEEAAGEAAFAILKEEFGSLSIHQIRTKIISLADKLNSYSHGLKPEDDTNLINQVERDLRQFFVVQ